MTTEPDYMQLLLGKCPMCKTTLGQCEHYRRGAKGWIEVKKKKSATAQAQKYNLNPLWRSERRRNQGER